jgi:hypothetical protein
VPLTAATWAATLRLAAEELGRMRVFIDDLDGWDGEDGDTGSNAHLTVAAMEHAVASLDPSAPLDAALEASAVEGLRGGVGHIGVLLAIVVSAWARAVGASQPVTPVSLRRMLRALPWEVPDAHLEWTVAVEAMFDEATSELDTLGETLPDEAGIVSRFSAQSQYGLVNATSERTGRVDAGAAVLAVLIACLDAAVRDDHAMLDSLARMLAELAGSNAPPSPRPQAPAPGRAFTVDVLLQGSRSDAGSARAALDALGVRYSCAGHIDLFGVGTWRLHVDTSAPLAVRPRAGAVRRFQVCDARPDEMIGQDTLSDGVTHRGVRLLERRTLRRVERAAVVALTRAPGLVEDLAQAGAVVLLDPDPADLGVVDALARRSSAGVCLVVPGSGVLPGIDEGDPARIVVAGSRDDLSALAVAQACGPLFLPQPGGPEVAALVAQMLRGTADQALARSTVVPLPGDADGPRVQAAVREVLAVQPRACRVLVSAGDGPMLVAVLRQVLAGAGPEPPAPDLEVMDGGQEGPSLLQGIR